MDSDALAGCKNCARFTPVPYVHSFSASLEQCKNQTWHAENAGWIVTPTSSELGTEAVANSSFCSGECLYSFLFSNELLSNKCADAALHFFKRVDAQRHPPRTGPNDGVDLRSSSPTEPELQDGPGDIFATPNASFHSHGTGQAVTAVL